MKSDIFTTLSSTVDFDSRSLETYKKFFETISENPNLLIIMSLNQIDEPTSKKAAFCVTRFGQRIVFFFNKYKKNYVFEAAYFIYNGKYFYLSNLVKNDEDIDANLQYFSNITFKQLSDIIPKEKKLIKPIDFYKIGLAPDLETKLSINEISSNLETEDSFFDAVQIVTRRKIDSKKEFTRKRS